MSETNFPSKLFRFLNEVEECNISHIASWQPHGRAFRIHNPSEFVRITNPRWFVYRSYTSFQRQLNIYGFQRITNGIDKDGYYHKNFLLGQADLLHHIHRIPVKKNVPLLSMTTSPLPDLYASSMHDNNSSTRAIQANPISLPCSIEIANTNTGTGTTLEQRRNGSTVNQFVDVINYHANQLVSQRLPTTSSIRANNIPLEGHHIPVNPFTTASNDSNSANLLQHIIHTTVDQYMPGIGTVNRTVDRINNYLMSTSLGSPSNSSTLTLPQLQNLVSQSIVNNMLQLRRNEPLVSSQAALLADQIRAQVQAVVAQLQAGQHTSPPQLQSLLDSAIASTVLQRNQRTSQTSSDLLAIFLSLPGMLNQRDDLSHTPEQLHICDDDQRQIGRDTLQSLPGTSPVGLLTTAASVGDGMILRNNNNHIRSIKNDNEIVTSTGSTSAAPSVNLPLTVASVDDDRIIRNCCIHTSSENNDNETVPTFDSVGQPVNDLNSTVATQKKNPSTAATNDLEMIANVLALYRSSS